MDASRRQLLKLAALGAAGGFTACTSNQPKALPSAPSAGPSASEPAPWVSFAESLSGSLQRPGSAGYDQARVLFNPLFDGSRPQGVAQCASADDVLRCLTFARDHALKVTARSGGHSYGGRSINDGLVIDLRALRSVEVDVGSRTATIGAGTALIDVYAQLNAAGVSLPAGSCPTVGIAGLALGGGYGVVSKKYGLTCDRLVSAEVVLADGRRLTASADSEPDLYWALRGGGGTCGIVTSFTFRTFPTQDVTIYAIGWSWSHAAEVLDGWQHWISTLPDETFSTCKLLANGAGAAGSPDVGVYGLHLGPPSSMATHLDALASAVSARPTYRTATPTSFAHAMFAEVGCADKDIYACRLGSASGAGQLKRQAFIAASDFLTAPMSRGVIGDLVAAVSARQTDPMLMGGGTSFDALGGAINRVRSDATAFVHRSALALVQHSAALPPDVAPDRLAADRRSLQRIQAAIRPAVSGEAYQNYLDSTLADPGAAYFGANLARLRDVQHSYDPEGVFSNTLLGI